MKKILFGFFVLAVSAAPAAEGFLAITLPGDMNNERNAAIVKFYAPLYNMVPRLAAADDNSYAGNMRRAIEVDELEKSETMRLFKQLATLNEQGKQPYYSKLDDFTGDKMILLRAFVRKYIAWQLPILVFNGEWDKFLEYYKCLLYAVAPESVHYAAYLGSFPANMYNFDETVPPETVKAARNLEQQLQKRLESAAAKAEPGSDFFRETCTAVVALKAAGFNWELAENFNKNRKWPETCGKPAGSQSPFRMYYESSRRKIKQDLLDFNVDEFSCYLVYTAGGQEFYCLYERAVAVQSDLPDARKTVSVIFITDRKLLQSDAKLLEKTGKYGKKLIKIE